MQTIFGPVFNRWDKLSAFARDVGCPEKTAREWVRNDSIPATWFAAVIRASLAKGFVEITADLLAALAERRRLAREAVKVATVEAAA